MKQRSAILLVLIVITTMPGCGIGYNSLLFVTKSNVGVDFDAKPPTAELAISRVEGVVEPVFENGKTLPVMASFRTSGSGLFAGEIGQTFTTGDAALVMALLYGDKDYEYSPLTDEGKKKIEKVFDSSLDVKLTRTEIERFTEKAVRPVFFGTSTSFGAKLSWSGMTAAFPDSLHIGYRRKELAWAPITYSEENGEGNRDESGDENGEENGQDNGEGNGEKKGRVSVPSLLATIDIEGEAKSPQKSQLKWLQYFATGKAATALALRQNVRRAMIRRLDPTVEFGAAFKGLDAQFAKIVLNKIESALGQLVSTYPEAQIHLDSLTSIAQAQLPITQYSVFEWSPSNKSITETATPAPNRQLAALISYGNSVDASAKDLSSALAVLKAGISVDLVDNAGVLVVTISKGDNENTRLQVTHDKYVAINERIDEIVLTDPAVVAAVKFYFNLLIK